MDTLIEMTIASGPAVLLIAAGIFWGKNIIEFFFSNMIALKKQELDQDLEVHKSELSKDLAAFNNQLSKAIEEYKSQLDIVKQEYQVQFSALHKERVDVIKQLYGKLLELHSAMVFFTRTMHPVINDADKEQEERINRLNLAYADFKNFYLPNKLYFSIDLTKMLDKLLEEYWTKGDDFARMQQFFKSKSIPKESFKYYNDRMTEISDYVIKEFPQLIGELESEFRILLGVKNK